MDQEARLRRREEARRRTVRRRRIAALCALLAALSVVVGIAVGAGGGGGSGTGRDSGEEDGEPPPPPELPRGGRSILPEHRVVAFYGAPQDDELGALGIGTPDQAGRRLGEQARAYARPRERPVLPAFELIAVVASNSAGDDGNWSYRQNARVVDRFHAAARRAKALYMLDIQPGHADFMDEARRFEKWLREPDVSLALDPEWHTPGAVPGSVIGSVDAAKVNEVAAWLGAIVRRHRLPEKLLVIHQFTEDMIVNRDRLRAPRGVKIVLNVDGFGNRAIKTAKYREFMRDRGRHAAGFKLFYKEDTNLLRPRDVMKLRPKPELVVYE